MDHCENPYEDSRPRLSYVINGPRLDFLPASVGINVQIALRLGPEVHDQGNGSAGVGTASERTHINGTGICGQVLESHEVLQE